MAPIWIEDVIFFLLATFIILIPVGGITARFALRPIVDALLRLREGFATQEGDLSERRFHALQAEIESLRTTVLLLSGEMRAHLPRENGFAAEPDAASLGRNPFTPA